MSLDAQQSDSEEIDLVQFEVDDRQLSRSAREQKLQRDWLRDQTRQECRELSDLEREEESEQALDLLTGDHYKWASFYFDRFLAEHPGADEEIQEKAYKSFCTILRRHMNGYYHKIEQPEPRVIRGREYFHVDTSHKSGHYEGVDENGEIVDSYGGY
ncbi:hypothetical protein ACFL21_01690 [Patescibacteria group bacterium]